MVTKDLSIHKHNDQFGFRYREVTSELSTEVQKEQINTLTHNVIYFQLEGTLHITWGDNPEVEIRAGELYFLPRGANISAYMSTPTVKYIAARLDHDLNNQSAFNMLLKNRDLEMHTNHKFRSLPIRKPLQTFIESTKQYMLDGLDSQQLQNAKFVELYFIFRNYYTKQECIEIFYPIMKQNSKFKTFILDNYHVSVSIEELMQKANMSRSTFDRTFKENFGITPLKWIEIQTRILIMRKASEPNVTVKDIMYEVEVNNPSQFTQLCKRLCGMTPSELIRR